MKRIMEMKNSKMNKKGSTMLVVLLAACYFMFGMILYQFLKPDIAVMRDASHMNCSSTTDYGDMGICLILDGVIPVVVIGILATAGGVITDKIFL